jgi:signal peptidase I
LPFLPQRDIRRGDIIVFKYPGKYQGEARFRNSGVNDDVPNNRPFITNYVKRVVGLPGDTIEVRGMQVLVNNQPLAEHRIFARNPPDDDPYTSGQENGAPLTVLNNPPPSGEGPYNVYWGPERYPTQPHATEGEKFVVPPEHYFVMGDNRDNSQDSRYWGYVPRDLIIGRAMFVYWSYDESAPSTGFFLSDFIKNTRWRRTGTMVK